MSGVCSGGGGREPVKIVLIKTQYIETDARSFKSVVQELTGKDSGARGSNLSPASKSRKVRSNLGTKIMEGGMNINGFAGESINNNNADRIQLDKFSILKSCNKPQKIRFFF